MTNPFEDEDGRHYVLVNGENQHSRPAPARIPPGWIVAHGADTGRPVSIYVEKNWTVVLKSVPVTVRL